jgi:hypothetical protein
MMITQRRQEVMMPLQEQEGWGSSDFSLLVAVISPLLLVGRSIPAVLTREREQNPSHTNCQSSLRSRDSLRKG